MNKIENSFDRGFSLKNDDFRWTDDAVRLALANLVKSLLNEDPAVSCILWGCEVSISNTTASVSEGAIFHLDEIWHVSAHSFTVPNPLSAPPNWVFRKTYDPAGVKTDKDLQSHNAYEIRDVVGWGTGSAPAGLIDSVEFGTIKTLRDILLGIESGTASISSVDPSVTGSVTLQKINGICHVSGELESRIDTDGDLICTFPAGFRPDVKMFGEAVLKTQAGTNIRKIYWQLDTNGEFTVSLQLGQAVTYDDLVITFPFQSFITA